MKIIYVLALLISLQMSSVGAETLPANPPDKEMFIAHLLGEMTLEEKVGQLTMSYDTEHAKKPELFRLISAGQTGAIIGTLSRAAGRELQDVAVQHTRLKIPLFFGFDVIHGYRTIFPIDLGLAASWDMDAIATSARIAAQEASADGVDMTFAPMVDISRDPRWGRVAESFGEDTYLVSRIAEVVVNAFQGPLPIASDRIMACVKHFALYGAVEGGRDYNSVDMSPVQMYQNYLPPFQAAFGAGADSVMIALNSINGVPATSNVWLLQEVLRREWRFNGMTLGDFGGISQLVDHGVAANRREASGEAIRAGLDMSLGDPFYGVELEGLVKSGETSQTQIDNAVRNVLATKYDMGLFDDPYRRLGRASEDPSEMDAESRLHRSQARDVARKTLVLLKNKDKLLPLKKHGTIALIGPLAKNPVDMLGSWSARGVASQVVTVYDGLATALGNQGSLLYAQGANVTDSTEVIDYLGDALVIDPRPETAMIDEAVKAAAQADVVVAVLGESKGMSGEAASRTSLDLPGRQSQLLTALKATGKPLVLVLMNGRPLSVGAEQDQADAVLETWFSGTEGGNAIADVLFGDYNPSGKLPITFPRSVGQIPSYYNHLNTGRPFVPGHSRTFSSLYYDQLDGPLYPFGYGLSYTDFSLSDVTLSTTALSRDGALDASVRVKNTGQRDGATVVQLYIQQVLGSISRPVKELKGFQKIRLKAGEEKTVHFTVDEDSLKFYNAELKYVAEPGAFNLQIGLDSQYVKQRSFQLL
ncbi:beta-glucosidase BglX [Pseudomonas sp. CCI3.2]|uniref:beta-glucosidase BglX n=1 Tax=unclassified Pseudomonas TaxID=196821 RepID=UPI002AC8FCE8|nr:MULTISPECIES: beta-glucosidase BglX [unclassified Pseudomonas]MEB0075779.1 beta-glucosidase BglX [Pseudomonas sp. MH10out]MEB0099744.1 beta-glucosidase BglX [Pseudomonas sp. CCI3.2]MEB0132855.1 beta-glucosidase BglX [Pseudomonas sp. CCI2.4]MEB0156426.1 beta-glucosidase BglX [Pseudomonas sp. AH2 (2023)]MEB0167249.1 beta-glucosidase BglX [Pseudomonas sp. CCC4.4]